MLKNTQNGDPYGTRTRVAGVKGRSPGPLDEGVNRLGRGIYECAGECHGKSFPGEPFIESSVDIWALLCQIVQTPTIFDSGDRTFLQRGSPPPPPWRLLPGSLFLSIDGGCGMSQFSALPIGGVAQLVRALACHARGREFESRHSRHFLICLFHAFLINTAVQSSELPVI